MANRLKAEVLAFFAVLVIAAIGLFFVSSPGMDNVTFLTVSTQTLHTFPNTVAITGMQLSQPFSDEVPPLTSTHFVSFKDYSIHTNEGRSNLRQTLRFSNRNAGFLGGSITYVRDQRGEVSDFLMFEDGEPIFEWEAIFSPGLESRIEDGKLIDLQDEKINILGVDYIVGRAEIAGDRIDLRFFGASQVEFVDTDFTDDQFTKKVEVNGNTVDGRVRIRGSRSQDKFRIDSIVYRFEGDHKLGGDVLVAPRRGIKQYLREPEGMLNPFFEIIYGGLRGGSITQSIQPRTRVGQNNVVFKPSGDDEYNLIFTNNRGQTYVVPFAANVGGSLRLGDDDSRLVVSEGSSSSDFNIMEGDMFTLTSDSGIKGITTVLEYDRVDMGGGIIHFHDLAGFSRQENFNPATGEGTLNSGGNNYKFFVELTAPNRIVVDQTHDGEFDGDDADFVILGGARVQVGGTGASAINVDFRTPKRLFDEATSDEIIDITIVEDGRDIDLVVPSQPEIDLERDKDRIKKGMSTFGVLLMLDDDDEPAELFIDFPTGGRSVAPFVRGGQAQGFVIVTLELNRLLAAAQG